MNTRNYTVHIKNRTVRLTDRDLAVFRDMYLGTSELTTRMSELIWLDMYILDAEFGVSPHDIIAAIKEVEAGPASAGNRSPRTPHLKAFAPAGSLRQLVRYHHLAVARVQPFNLLGGSRWTKKVRCAARL